MTESLNQFDEILQRNAPLAPLTWLQTGGPAECLLTPRSEEELLTVVRHCLSHSIPVRFIGTGSNILVKDGGVAGAVIRIADPLLTCITVTGCQVYAEAGALLSRVVSESVRAGLSGLEHLVGIPGTIGGAVIGNTGSRQGEIGDCVAEIEVVTQQGERTTRSGDDLSFSYRRSSFSDLLVLGVRLRLKTDESDDLPQRMRKTWIMKRATQPLADQSAGCIFRNPRGLSAGALIEQCGLKGMAVGKATVSDRHANFIVTEQGATSQDVLTLVDRVRNSVSQKFGVDLELEINVW